MDKPSDVERGSVVPPIPGNEKTIFPSAFATTQPSTNRRRFHLHFWKWVSSKSGDGHPIDELPAPEGGLTAWTVVVMCHLIGFNTWGFLNAFGVLQPYYVIFLDRSPSDVSWIGSLQAFFLFFTSAFSGRLTDAGYFHQ